MSFRYRTPLFAAVLATFAGAPAWAQTPPEQGLPGAPAAEQGQPGGATAQDPGQSREQDAGPGVPAQSPEQMGRDRAIDSATAPTVAGRLDNQLYAMTADELTGMELVDVHGQRVGEVSKVVGSRERDQVHVVISVSEPGDTPARAVTAALDELELRDGRLHSSASSAQIETRGLYNPEQYVEVERDQPLSEFSAFETVPEGMGAGGRPGGELPRAPAGTPLPDPRVPND